MRWNGVLAIKIATSAIARRYAGDEDFSNIRAQVKLIFLLVCTKRVVRH